MFMFHLVPVCVLCSWSHNHVVFRTCSHYCCWVIICRGRYTLYSLVVVEGSAYWGNCFCTVHLKWKSSCAFLSSRCCFVLLFFLTLPTHIEFRKQSKSSSTSELLLRCDISLEDQSVLGASSFCFICSQCVQE